jgi:hypothetical protein
MKQISFPISLWVAPPPELARYREMAECGFTIVPVVAESTDQGLLALELAQQVGVRVLIADPRIHRDLPDAPGWQEVVQAVVDDYSGHAALWGYLLTDEPHLRHFHNLALLARAFQSRDPERVPFINLFPNYASPDQLGTIEYEQHVRTFLDTVQPPILSYDHYALMEWGDRPGYFSNLEVIRRQALRARVPFWNVILSTPHFNYRDPSPADLRWQVYTTLAYGGQGLVYFTYCTPDAENYWNGILDLYGHRTAKYDVVRHLNLEMQHLGPHLQRLTSSGVSHWPDAPQGTTLLSGNGLVADIEGGEFVVGEFLDDEELPWLMAVNRDREHAAWTTLHLHTRHKVINEVSRKNGELRPVSRDQGVRAEKVYADGMVVNFWLAPAGARLLQLSTPDKGNG